MRSYWKNIKLFGLGLKIFLENVELNVLLVFNDRYKKTK